MWKDLVRHIPTRLVSVIKVFMANKGGHAATELEVIKAVSASPFVIHCYDAFSCQNRRCLLLEYAPFGNVDTLTTTRKGLGSDIMQLYAKEIALALIYLHSHGIIHRDVKPENMLILSSGHVVLADFSAAYRTTLGSPWCQGVCGTYLTRPPEVWNQLMYGQAVDVWMYGSSLYNIACNKWPFLHVSQQKQVQQVNSGQFKFIDGFFSTHLKNLIQETLQVHSHERIQTNRILDHEYFKYNDHTQEVPLSPSYLLSALVKSPVEREIVKNILQNNQQQTPEV